MRYVQLCLCLFITTSLVTQSIQQRIDALVTDPELKGASIGVDVVDLTT